MKSIDCCLYFPNTKYQTLKLAPGSLLSDHLTVQNSPVLFGCRTGICGTCLIEVRGDIPPPQAAEKELLEILAPNNNLARLACQIELTGDIEITKFAAS